jgi:hypothetical protein
VRNNDILLIFDRFSCLFLVRFIEETTTLEDLDISFNCLQVVGIEHIAKVRELILKSLLLILFQ